MRVSLRMTYEMNRQLAAAPGHVEHVRRLSFDGVDDQLLVPLPEALEQAYRSVVDKGTLPQPSGR